MMTEKELDTEVRTLAKLCGWLYYHTYRSKRSPAGFPDVVLVRPPRIIFAELKSGTGKLTVEQQEWISLLSAVPHVETWVWRPGDLEDIATLLSPRNRHRPPFVHAGPYEWESA